MIESSQNQTATCGVHSGMKLVNSALIIDSVINSEKGDTDSLMKKIMNENSKPVSTISYIYNLGKGKWGEYGDEEKGISSACAVFASPQKSLDEYTDDLFKFKYCRDSLSSAFNYLNPEEFSYVGEEFGMCSIDIFADNYSPLAFAELEATIEGLDSKAKLSIVKPRFDKIAKGALKAIFSSGSGNKIFDHKKEIIKDKILSEPNLYFPKLYEYLTNTIVESTSDDGLKKMLRSKVFLTQSRELFFEDFFKITCPEENLVRSSLSRDSVDVIDTQKNYSEASRGMTTIKNHFSKKKYPMPIRIGIIPEKLFGVTQKGGHAINIIGTKMNKTNRQCQVLLDNSWGNEWANSFLKNCASCESIEGGKYMYIDMAELCYGQKDKKTGGCGALTGVSIVDHEKEEKIASSNGFQPKDTTLTLGLTDYDKRESLFELGFSESKLEEGLFYVDLSKMTDLASQSKSKEVVVKASELSALQVTELFSLGFEINKDGTEYSLKFKNYIKKNDKNPNFQKLSDTFYGLID